MITKIFKIKIAVDTKEEMQKQEEIMAMCYPEAKELEPAEWIENEYHVQRCSRCGYTTSALSRFCPGCGAEMKRRKSK